MARPGLSIHDMYAAIVGDFTGAWNALAHFDSEAHPKLGIPYFGRGNFMFARQAMTLLEWAARLTTGNGLGEPYRRFSERLHSIDPRYFLPLPGPCGDNDDFRLPSLEQDGRSLLMWAVFDVLRHGLAHQYLQITVALTDGQAFALSVASGAERGNYLGETRARRSHLRYHVQDGDVWLVVAADELFLDIRQAIEGAALLGEGTQDFPYLTRPRRKGATYAMQDGAKKWEFSSAQLLDTFRSGGLLSLSDPAESPSTLAKLAVQT